MIATFVLVGVVLGFGVSQIPYFKNANTTQTAAVNAGQEDSTKPTSPEPEIKVLSADQATQLIDGDPVKGDANAPVTLVEFSDFQCPYCSRFAQSTIAPIEEAYVKSGKVKVVFRDYPLDNHPNALPAANAAECANEQGKFWEMHDKLFSAQDVWSQSDKSADVLKGYAKELRLDTKKFNSCFDTQKYNDEIKKDLMAGTLLGVQGTPGSFVNGKEVARYCWGMNPYTQKYEWQKMSGAMPFETVFRPIIDAELAGKKWQLEFDSACRSVTVKVD